MLRTENEVMRGDNGRVRVVRDDALPTRGGEGTTLARQQWRRARGGGNAGGARAWSADDVKLRGREGAGSGGVGCLGGAHCSRCCGKWAGARARPAIASLTFVALRLPAQASGCGLVM